MKPRTNAAPHENGPSATVAGGSWMSRRRFLALFTVAVGALIAVALAGPRRIYSTAKRRYLEHFGPGEEELAAALRQEFAHLRLADEAAREFVRDYRARGLYPLTLPLRRDVKLRFLLSTDFVPQQGDPAALISYTVFYDPYSGVCYNPFMLVPRNEAGLVI